MKANTTNIHELKNMDEELKNCALKWSCTKKADWFYRHKRTARKLAQKTKEFEAITMDLGRNLPVPNISTNDVYYKMQQSFMF